MFYFSVVKTCNKWSSVEEWDLDLVFLWNSDYVRVVYVCKFVCVCACVCVCV